MCRANEMLLPCGKRPQVERFCSGHSYQHKRYGRIWAVRPVTRKGTPCAAGDCDKPLKRQGYCSLHFARFLSGIPMFAPIPDRRQPFELCDRDSSGRKYCIECDRWLTESSFGERATTPDGKNIKCRMCVSARRHRTTGKFVLSLAEAVDWRCPGCSKPLSIDGARTFHLDHDHNCCPGTTSCGKCIRGILCERCNHCLGNAGDNVQTMRNLIAYLEAHNG